MPPPLIGAGSIMFSVCLAVPFMHERVTKIEKTAGSKSQSQPAMTEKNVNAITPEAIKKFQLNHIHKYFL